jgi:nicotinamide phosphoribosyltransferase
MSGILRALADTDSYKLSHWKQYPPNTTYMMSYLEARVSSPIVFSGLQYILNTLAEPTNFARYGDVLDEVQFMASAHGLPFNRAGWERILKLGYLPVRIRAVPEGTLVPGYNVLMTVESTDPETFWIVSWLETMLCRLWYPINVATIAYNIRQVIESYLEETSDDPESIWFKLHDFGSRGSSSTESAAIASMAHLTSFKGTDTFAGLFAALHHYQCPMAGFSISASEHSTITMWGQERERDAYRNMLNQYATGGTTFACVSDSYDIYHAVKQYWSTDLKAELLASGSTLVVRPDSGDPSNVTIAVLDILARHFGTTINSKNYKVLHPAVRVIYGDGMTEESIREVLGRMTRAGYATTNITFGMGGALVQQHNRDTHRIAFKCCAAEVDGALIDVYKDPSSDRSKSSKRGLLDLIKVNDEFFTVRREKRDEHSPKSVLRTVFENGALYNQESLETIRERLWPTR